MFCNDNCRYGRNWLLIIIIAIILALILGCRDNDDFRLGRFCDH